MIVISFDLIGCDLIVLTPANMNWMVLNLKSRDVAGLLKVGGGGGGGGGEKKKKKKPYYILGGFFFFKLLIFFFG